MTQSRSELDEGECLHLDPLIVQFDDFADAAEISALMAIGEPLLRPALVSAAKTGVASAGRTGRNAWIRHDAHPDVLRLCERISRLANLPLECAESLQMVHYAQGEQYAPHYDAWDIDTERGRRCLSGGGQRLVTCLLYLNEVAMGGATVFPKAGIAVEPRLGRLVLFRNVVAGSNLRHPDSLHGAAPVESGEKWACNLWFRESVR